MKPLISVVMANYNKGDVIEDTITSVLSQTYDNIEFIIVDDASTDNSDYIIRKYAKKDKRIKYFPQNVNRNFCYASNLGMSKATGEFITRIDSDDTWVKNKLEKQLCFFQKNSDCQILFTNINIIDENNNIVNDNYPHEMESYDTDELPIEKQLEHFFFNGNYFAHTSVMMKKSLFEKIGYYNNMYIQLQDFDYWIRAAKITKLYKLDDRLTNVRKWQNDKNRNISHINDEIMMRYINELTHIKKNFFTDMPDSLFKKAFKNYFVNKNASKKAELDCEKLFLLKDNTNSNNNLLSATNIEWFFKIINDDECILTLEKKYGYTLNNLYSEMKKLYYIDEAKRNHISNLEKAYTDLMEANSLLIKEKEQIINSTSWKITKPIRSFKNILYKIKKR